MAKTYLDYFFDLCSIPRGSGNTEKISAYCEAFAKQKGLRCIREECGNIIIFKAATPGFENAETVILQGHLDMVCVKREGKAFDFKTQGLTLLEKGDFIYADGTSLGGDDGIAVAFALAILDSEEIKHPKLEVVLTVDEETGMDGASALDVSPLEGKMLVNIDSEDEGTLLSSCAGGIRADVLFEGKKQQSEKELLKISISSLAGGHSGTEIDKNRKNAIILLSKMLKEAHCQRLASLSGGSADNAIASFCSAVVEKQPGLTQKLKASFEKEKGSFSVEDCNATISFEKADNEPVFCTDDSKKLLSMISDMPNGVIAFSKNVKGLTETSLNLGMIKTEREKVMLGHALRSSVKTEKQRLLKELCDYCESLGATVSTYGDYPAWEYRENSRLRDAFISSYRELYGKEMKVTAIHAGLECGIFCGKIQDLDCVSMGPDIFDIHSPDERLSKSSCERTFKLLCTILERLNNQ